MPYMGTPCFHVCTYCTRMYNNLPCCPVCGNPKTREFRDTTTIERQRWKDKKYFADPAKETP